MPDTTGTSVDVHALPLPPDYAPVLDVLHSAVQVRSGGGDVMSRGEEGVRRLAPHERPLLILAGTGAWVRPGPGAVVGITALVLSGAERTCVRVPRRLSARLVGWLLFAGTVPAGCKEVCGAMLRSHASTSALRA